MSQWVRHISGQGEKWEVIHEHQNDAAFRVKGKRLEIHPTLEHYLPKSEYVRCEPPEQWVDMTAGCTASAMQVYHGDLAIHIYAPNYRLRKVQIVIKPHESWQWVFLVERREP